MPSRDSILKSIQNNLKNKTKKPLPSIELKDFTSFDDKKERLKEALQELGANFEDIDIKNIENEVTKLCKTHEAKIVYNTTSHNIALSNFNDENAKTPQDLANIDLVVIETKLAVAENGAVWVEYKNFIHRVLPAICKHVVILLNSKDIVNNMLEAYENIPSTETGSNGGFIAGPSKTADIERSLVLGAHGAFTVTVLIY